MTDSHSKVRDALTPELKREITESIRNFNDNKERYNEGECFRVQMKILRKIPSLGDMATSSLLHRFSSIDGIAIANIKELERVKTIGPDRAKLIYGALEPYRDSVMIASREAIDNAEHFLRGHYIEKPDPKEVNDVLISLLRHRDPLIFLKTEILVREEMKKKKTT